MQLHLSLHSLASLLGQVSCQAWCQVDKVSDFDEDILSKRGCLDSAKKFKWCFHVECGLAATWAYRQRVAEIGPCGRAVVCTASSAHITRNPIHSTIQMPRLRRRLWNCLAHFILCGMTHSYYAHTCTCIHIWYSNLTRKIQNMHTLTLNCICPARKLSYIFNLTVFQSPDYAIPATAILIRIEDRLQVFQRFSSSNLVLKTVESRYTTLIYYENGSMTHLHTHTVGVYICVLTRLCSM